MKANQRGARQIGAFRPTRRWIYFVLYGALLAMPTVLAQQNASAGTANAWAKDEPGLAPARGTSADAQATVSVVPPDCLLCSSTFVQLSLRSNGNSWISDACNVGQYLCHAQTVSELSVPAKGIDEFSLSACTTGSGCAPSPTGIGRVMSDEDITVGFSVNHGLAGTNSEVVGFTVCSNAQIYLDLNGNGQWSDEAPWRESNDCDGGSVRVSAL